MIEASLRSSIFACRNLDMRLNIPAGSACHLLLLKITVVYSEELFTNHIILYRACSSQWSVVIKCVRKDLLALETKIIHVTYFSTYIFERDNIKCNFSKTSSEK